MTENCQSAAEQSGTENVALKIEASKAAYAPGETIDIRIHAECSGAAGKFLCDVTLSLERRLFHKVRHHVDVSKGAGLLLETAALAPMIAGRYDLAARLARGETVYAETSLEIAVIAKEDDNTGG